MIEKFKRATSHPAAKEALQSIKPKKNFWGIFSVILLFIFPEIIAFIWGTDITAFCEAAQSDLSTFWDKAPYKVLEMLFSQGSWLNLLVGFALLIWLFF